MTELRNCQITAIEQIELAIDAPLRSLRDRSPAKRSRMIAFAKAKAKERAA